VAAEQEGLGLAERVRGDDRLARGDRDLPRLGVMGLLAHLVDALDLGVTEDELVVDRIAVPQDEPDGLARRHLDGLGLDQPVILAGKQALRDGQTVSATEAR